MLVISKAFRFCYTSNKAFKHGIKNSLEGKLFSREEIRVMKIDKPAEVKACYQFDTQVIPVHSLADAFRQVDLDLFINKVPALGKVFLINIREMVFQDKSH